MSVFGSNWKNHTHQIREGWKVVGLDDLIIIAGDISWASKIENTREDFEFLEALPGKKILSCGNHDHWHSTSSKTTNYLFDNYRTLIPLFRNDYLGLWDNIALCSIVGFMSEDHPEFKQEYRKAYEKEYGRLEDTLKRIPTIYTKVFVISHYPPVFKKCNNTLPMNIMRKYDVDTCIYGHLHGDGVSNVVEGNCNGINLRFVAGDSNRFVPKLICEL